jgi:NitT/TauT family transport system ATP-binding protein
MLSGGMRQKVALAQMMINKPELVLLDEPFSSQDFFTKIQLENLFHKTIRGNKLSAILVTHDIDEAIALSDRIIVLSQKPCRILQDITLDFHVGEDRLLPEEVREMPSISSYFADIYQTLKPEL